MNLIVRNSLLPATLSDNARFPNAAFINSWWRIKLKNVGIEKRNSVVSHLDEEQRLVKFQRRFLMDEYHLVGRGKKRERFH